MRTVAFIISILFLTLQYGCVANRKGKPKVVNSPKLTEEEKGISLQLLSVAECASGKQPIYQCSGLRIHENGFVSAGHCYKPNRKYYLLASYNQMIEIRALSDVEGGSTFQKEVSCELLDKYLKDAVLSETAFEIPPDNVFVAKEYLDRIVQKTSSPIKMAYDFAVVRAKTPVLNSYPQFATVASADLVPEEEIRHYGTGLDNCFVIKDGETKKIRSSKIDQDSKSMGVGRVDANFISEGESTFVIRTEYSDSDKQKDSFQAEAEYLAGVMLIRNRASNFPCGGDSGGGYLRRVEETDYAVAIHRASVYDHVEVPYSVGVRLDSKWSCALFAKAEMTVEACQ